MREHEETLLRDSLRRSRARKPRGARIGRYATTLMKDMLSREDDRTKACAKIVSVQRALFEAGAKQSDLEDFWLLGLAITRAWFAEQQRPAVDPHDASAVRAELARLNAAEQVAQGAREEAERALAYDPSPANAQRFIEAQAAYTVADAALRDFVRQYHVRRELAVLRRGRVTVTRTMAAARTTPRTTPRTNPGTEA